MNRGPLVLGMLIGAVIGGVGTYFAMLKKCNSIIDEEVEEVRQVYESEKKDCSKCLFNVNPPEPVNAKETITKTLDAAKTEHKSYNNVIKEQNYSGKTEEIPKDYINEPYLITEDDDPYGEHGYNTVELIYFDDDVLIYDFNGTVVDNRFELLGVDGLNQFDEEGLAYIRCDATKTDYKVIKSLQEYGSLGFGQGE